MGAGRIFSRGIQKWIFPGVTKGIFSTSAAVGENDHQFWAWILIEASPAR